MIKPGELPHEWIGSHPDNIEVMPNVPWVEVSFIPCTKRSQSNPLGVQPRKLAGELVWFQHFDPITSTLPSDRGLMTHSLRIYISHTSALYGYSVVFERPQAMRETGSLRRNTHAPSVGIHQAQLTRLAKLYVWHFAVNSKLCHIL
jgi:hypothetical protein